MREKYDVFVSHATKDKEKYVNKLVENLKIRGIKVFYDEDCIKWGDSVSGKIKEGLANCRLAIVVISKNYFGREWTEHELSTLLKRQYKEGKRIILPILHNVSKKELVQHYPSLNDVSYIYSKSCSFEKMIEVILDKLNC